MHVTLSRLAGRTSVVCQGYCLLEWVRCGGRLVPGEAVKEEEFMPLVSVFNLRREDRLSELEEATRLALTSMPELAINDYEIDLVPVLIDRR